MTLVQLEYIVAVDTYRHFAAAAGHCFVTQPTLSMQVQETGRRAGPEDLRPQQATRYPHRGRARAYRPGQENNFGGRRHRGNSTRKKRASSAGSSAIGIIPTLAPLPPAPVHPGLHGEVSAEFKLVVGEMTTDTVVARLREGRIDVGILVTPLQESGDPGAWFFSTRSWLRLRIAEECGL